MGNEDCGRFYQSIGDLQRAYEAYHRMRQDAVIDKHILELNKHLASVTIEQKNWIGVHNHAAKLQAISEAVAAEESKAVRPLIRVAQGLAYLAQKKYADAATAFLGVDSGMGSSYNDIISGNDVAVYGGLCALASMDRDQLQKRVLNSSTFRTYLELEPQIRRAITAFVNGRYSACLSTLEGYRNDYLLDIYLSSNVPELFRRIRSKSIVQYFKPFSCVTLDSLNESFAASGESIEDELVAMIKAGTLNARIDTINGVSFALREAMKVLLTMRQTLNAVIPSPRAEIQKQTLESVKEYERELRRRILRMNIINAGLELKGSKKQNLLGVDRAELDLDFAGFQSPPQRGSFAFDDFEMEDETLGD